MAPRRTGVPRPLTIVGRVLAAALLETAVLIFVAWLNPFHIDEWAFERNQVVWQRIMGDEYGCQGDRPHSKSEKLASKGCEFGHLVDPPPVSIVYLDDTRQLTRKEGRTPTAPTTLPAKQLSLADQSDALQDLAQSPRTADGVLPNPRAVFVDFLFNDADPDRDPKLGNAFPAVSAAEAKQTACAHPDPQKGQDDARKDPFGCYVARVAVITHYDAWGRNDRCRINALTKLLCIVDAKGTPVVFATSASINASELSPDPPPTEAEVALDQVAIMAPSYLEGPGYQLAPVSGVHPFKTEMSLRNHEALSPVAVLYAAACLTPPTAACPMLIFGSSADIPLCQAYVNLDLKLPKHVVPRLKNPNDLDERLCRLRWNKHFTTPIAVWWGVGHQRAAPAYGPDPRFPIEKMLERLHGNATVQCRSAHPGFWARAGRLLAEAIPIFASEGGKPLCRYVPAIPYPDFDRAITDADRALILKDKIVMFGGQYQTSGDWVKAISEDAPGIHYHAMALTNLLDHDKDYAHVELPVVSGSAFSLAAWPSFLAALLINAIGGVGIMLLNEPALDPARSPSRRPEPAASALRRLLWRPYARWLARIVIAFAPFLVTVVAFAFLVEPLFALNLTVLLAVLAMTGVKLTIHAAKPLLEEGNRFFRFLDVADARLTGPDIDPPIRHAADHHPHTERDRAKGET